MNHPTEQDEDVSNTINIGNPRFVTSNTEVVDKFLEDGINKNTKVKTDQEIKLFQEFLVSVAESRPILQIPPEELSAYVSNFIFMQ
jgi:predicted HTH domain antitoxin